MTLLEKIREVNEKGYARGIQMTPIYLNRHGIPVQTGPRNRFLVVRDLFANHGEIRRISSEHRTDPSYGLLQRAVFQFALYRGLMDTAVKS